MQEHSHKPSRVRLACLLPAVATLVLQGCASYPGGPSVARKVYDPPQLSPYQRPLLERPLLGGSQYGSPWGVQLGPRIEPFPGRPVPSPGWGGGSPVIVTPPGVMPGQPGITGPVPQYRVPVPQYVPVPQSGVPAPQQGAPVGPGPGGPTIRQYPSQPPPVELQAPTPAVPETLPEPGPAASPAAPRSPLVLNVSAPETCRVGESVDFAIQIVNGGPERLSDVTIECFLDEGFEFPGATERAFRQSLGAMESGTDQTIDLTLTCTQAGEHCVRFELTAEGAAAVDESHCIEASDKFVELELIGPRVRSVGSTAEYVVTVANVSGRDLPGVRVVLQHDSVLEPREASKGMLKQPGRLTWDLGVMRAAERVQIQVEFACPEATSETLVVAEVSGLNAQQHSQRALLSVVDPGLLDVTIEDSVDLIHVGQTTEYAIRVRNRGLEPARAVRIQAMLDERLQIRRATINNGIADTAMPPHLLSSEPRGLVFPVIEIIPPDGAVSARIIAEGRGPGPGRIDVTVAAQSGPTIAASEATVVNPPGR